MKRDYSNKLSKIEFEIVKQKKSGIYELYMQSDSRKVLCGTFDEEWKAKTAAEELGKKLNMAKTSEKIVHERHKISMPTIKSLQAIMLGLDPQRAAAMREELITLNYCTHMMADSVDNLSELFGGMIDKSMRQHYKLAAKQIDALLDAVYTSQIMGSTAQDYTNVAAAAYALKERFKIFVSYVGKDGWRFEQMEKTLCDLVPEGWLHDEREKVGNEIRECFRAVEQQAKAPIMDRKPKTKKK